MLVGHLAVGLIGKRTEPKVSLGTWILAAFLADLILFPLLILGVEHVQVLPGVEVNRAIGSDIVFSHSLVMDLVWGLLFAGAYFLLRRHQRSAWLLFTAVVSHWVLDFISHRPDMPLSPAFTRLYGLGLWNSIPATVVVEGGFWLLALVLYAGAIHPATRLGSFAFWAGTALLTLVWYGNLRAGMDPDPVKAGIGGLISFSLLVAWGYWIDRLRPAKA